MRSNYPAKDNDRKLTAFAQTALPIIKKIELYKKETGSLPVTLEKLGVQMSQIPRISYVSFQPGTYMIWIKLGWDPSLSYA